MIKAPTTVAYFTTYLPVGRTSGKTGAEALVRRYLYGGFDVVGTSISPDNECWATLVRFESTASFDSAETQVAFQIGRLQSGPFSNVSFPNYLTREESK